MRLLGDADLAEVLRKLHGCEEELSGLLDGFFCGAQIVGSCNAPDIASILGKNRCGLVGEDVLHPDRSQNCKPLPVGDVVERGELMLHRMDAPCRRVADTGQSVDREGGRPHQVRAGIVVLRLVERHRAILEHDLQQAFTKALLDISAGFKAEVILEGVADHVCGSCRRLLL